MGRGHAVRAPALILVLSLLAPSTGEAAYRFGDGVYLGSASLLPDWAETLQRARDQHPILDACVADAERCEGYLRGIPVLLQRARPLSRERQLQLINRYINKRRYRGDRTLEITSALSEETVRLPSRWSTLLEFLRRGGDCEDYATSKYQLLRALGIPAHDLRVVVVFDRASRDHHAVLAVRQDDDGAAWLLDSDDRIYRGQPFGYRFIYALNETSIWDHEVDGDTVFPVTQPQEQPEDSS
ncbi:MAG: transglutaminase-like cysteine peptidase [Pseudomonadales bacterium]